MPARRLLSGALQLAAHILAAALLSTALYAALYNALVPRRKIEYPLHFATCTTHTPPPPHDDNAKRAATRHGTHTRDAHLAFDAASLAAAHAVGLAEDVTYQMLVCVEMPESPPNVNAGTFMLSAEVLSRADRRLAWSERPLILRYKSAQLRWMWTVFYALPLLFGWISETQTQCTELMPAYLNTALEPASRVVVKLSSCDVQLYSATLTARAEFPLVASFMHSFFFTSAAIGISVFMMLYSFLVIAFELRNRGSLDGGGPAAVEPSREVPIVDLSDAGGETGRDSPYTPLYAASEGNTDDPPTTGQARPALPPAKEAGSHANDGVRRRLVAGAGPSTPRASDNMRGDVRQLPNSQEGPGVIRDAS